MDIAIGKILLTGYENFTDLCVDFHHELDHIHDFSDYRWMVWKFQEFHQSALHLTKLHFQSSIIFWITYLSRNTSEV